MTEHHHPIRDYAIHVYHCETAEPSFAFRAFFGAGAAFPIYFNGATFREAQAKAETFRQDTIEKHEKAFIDRKNALKKARKARKAKAARDAAEDMG